MSEVDHTMARTGSGSTGQQYVFGVADFTNTSDEEVRFTDVRPVEPTPGLVIDSIEAVDNCRIRKSRIGFVLGPVARTRPDLEPRPIAHATIAPNSESCWYFIVTAHADRPGTYECRAFDLVYQVDGRTEQHRRRHGIALDITTTTPDWRADRRLAVAGVVDQRDRGRRVT